MVVSSLGLDACLVGRPRSSMNASTADRTRYLMVALSSLLENVAGSPFTTQYTIRVSRAPKVRISPDAPSVLAVYPESEDSSLDQKDHRQSRMNPFRSSSPPPPPPKNGNHVSIASGFNKNPTENRRTDDGTLVTSPMLTHIPTIKDDYDDFSYDRGKNPPLRSYTAALKDLEEGYNTTGRIIIDPEEPSAHARTPFYVIISVEEVSKTARHAASRFKGHLGRCFRRGDSPLCLYCIYYHLRCTNHLVSCARRRGLRAGGGNVDG